MVRTHGQPPTRHSIRRAARRRPRSSTACEHDRMAARAAAGRSGSFSPHFRKAKRRTAFVVEKKTSPELTCLVVSPAGQQNAAREQEEQEEIHQRGQEPVERHGGRCGR